MSFAFCYTIAFYFHQLTEMFYRLLQLQLCGDYFYETYFGMPINAVLWHFE